MTDDCDTDIYKRTKGGIKSEGSAMQPQTKRCHTNECSSLIGELGVTTQSLLSALKLFKAYPLWIRDMFTGPEAL
jgi:hypothetical protein